MLEEMSDFTVIARLPKSDAKLVKEGIEKLSKSEFDSLVSHLTTVSVFGVGKALEDKLKPEENEFLGVKVGFQMDLSGILRIEKAEAVVQRKSQGVVECELEVLRRNGRKSTGPVPDDWFLGIQIACLKENFWQVAIEPRPAKDNLEEFEKRERHARERAAAENELEGYAFEVSQIVEEEDYIKHSTEEERSKLLQESKRIRSWLEDEVNPNTATADFTKNHAILVALVRPIKKRIDEGKLKSLDRELNSFMKKMKQTKLKDVEERMKNDSKKKDDKSEKEENVTTAEKAEQSTATEKEAGTEGVKADSQGTEQPLDAAGEAPAVEKEGAKETKAGEAKSQAADESDANVEKVEL
ncbi:hypothetical protein TELCIR_17184 [Teladorsagia circumcincta]|uniref:Hypoxia up-regulated protein 1 n=1 Tax=Teladorsagia circumcincta TaxID=45464 RepID=A0A2G9TTI3_TELCI|nr:hypothetical protein TELCIR_17184 [Teladorsagia circumcincta]